ncbi:MAG: septal ring lytic transglycosylase RlpA family lipoprotein [Burkholderiales bacterium PBB1]|nr:MAG: septal ring lytic transglycosylase RlpA family lipoprotein [Burkholderiales bacterium PBB1]
MWRAALTLTAVLWLVGCASTPGGSGGPAPAPTAPIDYTGRDGPPAAPPPNLADIPNAEPRVETIKPGGANKPYEIAGQRYEPIAADVPYRERGLASWYGRKFHGRPTSSGEPYDMYAMTAAHPTLPIPSYARVRNPANGREIVVRINDRGPFHSGRIIDLSYTAALKLDLLRGVAPVEVERLTHEAIRTGAWHQQAPAQTFAVAATPSPAPSVVQNITSAPPPATSAQPVASVAAAAEPPAPDVPTPALPPRLDPSDVTPAAATPARGFWVQLGAFRQRDGADRLHQRLSSDLSWLAPLLAVFNDRNLLRVQAGPYADRAEAARVAQRVRASASLAAVVIERR